MEKNKSLATKDLHVIKQVMYKGIKVILAVDFVEKKISLTEPYGNGYQPKKYVFARRSRDYLGSWLNIMEAMQEAVKIGNQMLLEREQLDTDAQAELLINVAKNMAEDKLM